MGTFVGAALAKKFYERVANKLTTLEIEMQSFMCKNNGFCGTFVGANLNIASATQWA